MNQDTRLAFANRLTTLCCRKVSIQPNLSPLLCLLSAFTYEDSMREAQLVCGWPREVAQSAYQDSYHVKGIRAHASDVECPEALLSLGPSDMEMNDTGT